MSEKVYKRRTLKGFTDKNTKKPYPKGSTYESTDTKRINELVKKGNVSGEEVKTMKESQEAAEAKAKEKYEGKKVESADKKVDAETSDELKHVGGGNYELPNGERIKGKENAEKALKNGGE